jgi:hypothetical protein
MAHHNGYVELFEEPDERTRFVWTTDMLPDDIAEATESTNESAMPLMKATLEKNRAAPVH